jgi:hypothetical protein
MGKMGCGYGSEWHLLRYLGYHREYLTLKALEATGGKSIQWQDFRFLGENHQDKKDRELKGVEFIKNELIQNQWKSFWPQTANVQNWDLVGQVQYDDHYEWLLVEAKAHLDEIKSGCKAIKPSSMQTIRSVLKKTSKAFGCHSTDIEKWLKPYYQYANRLAVLYFLMKECKPPIKSRLLFLYFYGDKRSDSMRCPQSEQEWQPSIDKVHKWLGIDENCELARQKSNLILPITRRHNEKV